MRTDGLELLADVRGHARGAEGLRRRLRPVSSPHGLERRTVEGIGLPLAARRVEHREGEEETRRCASPRAALCRPLSHAAALTSLYLAAPRHAPPSVDHSAMRRRS